MKKRILALVCMLALLIGVFAVGATATSDSDGMYDVGYSKKDVNPWVQSEYISIGIPAQYTDENGNLVDYTDAATYITNTTVTNHDQGTTEVQTPLVKVKLSGYGTISERRAESVSDDNGDGLVGLGDGLQVTATSVTDDWGKTVIYMTIDSIGGYEHFTKAVRNAVVAELGADVIATNDIMVSGSHSHEAPDLGNCSGSAAGTALRAYYDYYVARATAAAVEAYNSRTPATMTKGSIEASDHFGQPLNFVRHYDITKEEGWVIKDTHTWVGGDNFGGSFSEDSDDGFFDTSNTTLDHVSEANQTMNILQFTRDGENPIVLIQWQAHPSIMGSSSRTNISSDYINALRYRLENNKSKFGGSSDYCVGFWQGTGGNMNNSSRISAEYTYTPADPTGGTGWIATNPSTVGLTLTTDGTTSTGTDQNRTYRNALYGYILGTVALDCLESNMTSALDMGKIRTVQSMYKAERQQDSEGLIAAAAAWRTEYDAGNTITYPYTYTHTDNVVYALNSYYHAYNVEQRAKSTSTHSNLELNAIMLGSQVAMVTAPLELFDRYSLTNTTGSTSDNDWDDLTDTTFGEPFILSKSNSRAGYVPNAMAYDYYTDQTGTVAEGTKMGSYEANTTVHARGVGEAIVAYYGDMLDLAQNGYVDGTCPKCGEVEWTPLTAEATSITNFGTGHFYLTEDMLRPGDYATNQKQKVVNAGEKLCINLNGYTMETEGRTFNIANDAELNIINTAVKDAGTTGVVRAYSGDNNPGGGVITMNDRSLLNIYGGTFEFVAEDTAKYGTGVGGIISLKGTVNMYGGTIKGAELVDSSYSFGADGCGAAIYMYSNGNLNVYGGSITSGTLPTANDLPTAGKTCVANGPCVYVSASNARVKLANDANVENIYFAASNGNLLTVDGVYTGTATVTTQYSLSEGLDIGNVTNGGSFTNITSVQYNDDKTTTTPTGYSVRVARTDLILTTLAEDVVAAAGSTGFTTLQNAVDSYTGELTNYAIKLMADIEEDVVLDINRTVVINLNGYNIRSVTVNAGKVLCMDSTTDDYDVSDNVYGKILTSSGNIAGYNTDGSKNANSYLKVDEDGALSFHGVNLKLTAMTLRPEVDGQCAPSVYYKSNFKGDEKVKAAVKQYGIALSITEMPDETNIDDEEGTCKSSKFTSFTAGSAGNSGNGTLLKGIMKPTNAALVNRRNANKPVYGRAYLLTNEGEYLFGGGYQKTLAQQAADADDLWSDMTDEQKTGLVNMYNTYTSIVSKWDMTNLTTAMGPTQDGALKVLVIGNSHGLDATNLLYEVFKDQGYDEQELVLGALYYSGCNMTQHASFMTNGDAVYDYYENDGSNADGSWNITNDTVVDTALDAHEWDIIILQQMNHRAGYDSTASYAYKASDFNTVINYVKERQIGMPKFGWHMVWTNPDEESYVAQGVEKTKSEDWRTNHDTWFPGDDGSFDQSVMYEKIVACTQKYIEGDVSFLGSDVFDFVIPVATAVEYAQDVLGLTQAQVYRDYTHMNDYGRLIAAYTWYAKILELDQIPAVGIDAIPTVLHHENSEYPTADSGYAVTDDMKKLIRNAVNYALDNPYELPAEEDNTVSILGIGNSYTIDSMWMLGEVYQAENPGKDVKLGIAYRSGESLSGHVTNITAGNTYTYFYWDSTSDKWTVTAGQTLEAILAAQEWETVSMQQGSGSSGVASTYDANIQTIQTYVEEQLGYVPTYLWNMTWAYPMEDIEDNYTLETAPNANSFANYYGSSQATMYKAIVGTVQEKILPDATFEYLMPVGTAIQNANGTLTDFELYRDYTHLSDFSRLMAAYTWYCELELTTLDDFQLKALPTVNCSSTSWYNGAARDLTSDELALAIECVKAAMKDNFTTTDASVYAE